MEAKLSKSFYGSQYHYCLYVYTLECAEQVHTVELVNRRKRVIAMLDLDPDNRIAGFEYGAQDEYKKYSFKIVK